MHNSTNVRVHTFIYSAKNSKIRKIINIHFMLSYFFYTFGTIFIISSMQILIRLSLKKNYENLSLALLHITGTGSFGCLLIILGISMNYSLCYLLFIILIIMLPVSSSLLAKAIHLSK